MIVRLGSKLTLWIHHEHSRLIDYMANYFALIQSNIVLAGLPMLIGSLSSAYLSGALMDPAPGNNPSEVGYVLSSFVARN
jgi:hypothetical protein